MHRRGSYNATLIAMIVLVLATILFGILAYLRYTDNQIARVGDPENPASQDNSLEQRKIERDNLARDVTSLEKRVENLKKIRHYSDMELGSHGIRWVEATNSWSTDGEEGGSPWVRTRESIQSKLNQLTAYQRELEGQTDIHRPLEDTIRRFQDEIHGVMQTSTDVDARLQDDRDRLETQLDELEDAKEDEEEVFATTKSELATRKSQLEARIRELLELRLVWLGELQPDGRILERQLDGDYVVLDIGSSDRVFNGLRLEVFHYDHGRYVKKGMAEVIDTGANVATARLVEELDSRHNPVTKGDMVANPIFDTQEAPVVVLAGEFYQFNRDDLASFLRRTGAEVRDELGPGIDYLIAGNRSDAQQDEAREYRVIAMTEEQLIQYLHAGFRPRDD